MNKYTIAGYTRISKQAARKLHAAGKPIHVAPCKMRPSGPWYTAVAMDPAENFDTWLNAFSYYNCDNERGKYPAFYVKGA